MSCEMAKQAIARLGNEDSTEPATVRADNFVHG